MTPHEGTEQSTETSMGTMTKGIGEGIAAHPQAGEGPESVRAAHRI